MTTRIADVIVETLADLGIRDVFAVTGGAAMHLNDAFGLCDAIQKHYMHHEQACAIAAEGYARIDWKPAAVCVTAGPGAINAFNGVFGAFTDSVPMFVVSGQSRSDMLLTSPGVPEHLRQLGDQEANIIPMVREICKAVHQLSADDDVAAVVTRLFREATTGRPGPVWLEVPVNIQGLPRTETPSRSIVNGPPVHRANTDLAEIDTVVSMIRDAQRPVIIAGTGVRAAGGSRNLVRLAEKAEVPVATAWTHDVFPSDHPLHAGRPGTIGTRPGNLVVQAADLVVVLGSRLNIRQVSYNWDEFAPNAQLIHVDIDAAELHKPYLAERSGLKVVADLTTFLPALVEAADGPSRPRSQWLNWVREMRARWEPTPDDYPLRSQGINAYHFVMELAGHLGGDDVVVSGDATACIVPFQVLPLTGEMRLFSNSGCASMGYDLPAALGASIAAPTSRVICLAGDGSVMMNLHELQSLRAWNRNIIVFILDNNGYLSIKQTQSNFFGRSNGAAPESGVSFPNFEQVAKGFDLAARTLTPDSDWRATLAGVLRESGPRVCVVKLDQDQEFEPRIKSRMTEAGIVTPPLDDMFPHLEDDVLARLRAEGRESGITRDWSSER